MALKVDDLFNSNLFEVSPEDGQTAVYEGGRIVPTTVDVGGASLTAMESALNTLELQAASSITPGNYVGIKMDTFKDSDGYLNTISTGSTTASYSGVGTGSYLNGWSETPLTISMDSSYSYGNSNISGNFTAYHTGYITSIPFKLHTTTGAPNTYRINIVQNGNTIATKTITLSTTTLTYMTLTSSDYTSPINPGTFNVNVVLESGTATREYDDFSASGYSNALWNANNVYYMMCGTSAGATWQYTPIITNRIICTNTITLPSSFSNFQIIAFRGITNGTSSITADVSFDNGLHWQTGMSLNEDHSITYPGTSLIVKINLNGIGAGNTSSCKGYGVQLW